MRKIFVLIFCGFLLSGCYASSLTYVGTVGTGAGIVSGKSAQSIATQTASMAIKQKTGKSPLEHMLNQEQIKTYEKTKAKLNPCEQTPELCSKINLRVAVINNILEKNGLEKNLKAPK